MSANRRRRRRDRYGGGGHDGGDERWLLTYADMITLLMALFIVMWAISSTNVSKFKLLKQSLQQAFSGKVIAGNDSVLVGDNQIMESGTQGRQGAGQAFFDPADEVAKAFAKKKHQLERARERAETQSLRRLQERIESYARTHGFEKLIDTRIDERGLVVRLLTDEVLFPTGSSDLQSGSLPLLDEISRLLAGGTLDNPVRVEGNTDDRPISSADFHSNWELSTARADAVLQVLLADGVPAHRLSVAGYADQRPVATNATEEGRARNRHVDLVVLRKTAVNGGS